MLTYAFSHWRRSAWIVSILLLLCKSGFADASANHTIASFPFRELPNGFIVFNARIDKSSGHPVLLDLGSTMPFLIDLATANTLELPKLPAPRPTLIEGPAGTFASHDWRKAIVRAEHVIIQEQAFPALDLSGVAKTLGVQLQGIAGVGLASYYVVEIDYQTHRVRLYEPEKYTPAKTGMRFDLMGSTLLVFQTSVVLKDCTAIQLRVHLDTGSNDGLVFKNSFVRSHPKYFPDFGTALSGVAVDGSQYTVGQTEIRELRIGSFSFDHPTAVYQRTPSDIKMGDVTDASVGSSILRNFTLVIDRPHSALYLLPRPQLQSRLKTQESCPAEGPH